MKPTRQKVIDAAIFFYGFTIKEAKEYERKIDDERKQLLVDDMKDNIQRFRNED